MVTESSYAEMASALETRVKIIGDRAWYLRDAPGHLEALGHISEKIESLASALPQPVPGELAHYLERRSYDKALAWIQQRQAA